MDIDYSKIKRIIRKRKKRAPLKKICSIIITYCLIVVVTAINDAQILIINVIAITSR